MFFLRSDAHLNYCTAPESKQISMMHTPWTTLIRKPCSSLDLAKGFVKPLGWFAARSHKTPVAADSSCRKKMVWGAMCMCAMNLYPRTLDFETIELCRSQFSNHMAVAPKRNCIRLPILFCSCRLVDFPNQRQQQNKTRGRRTNLAFSRSSFNGR